MSDIEADVRWTLQWLKALNMSGFASIFEMEAGALRRGGDLNGFARHIIACTRHLSHPSLTALRKHFPAEGTAP